MKAKSRKRLLISSIAMLLVAMIALGTATFAWFTSSTTATASGINVQTTQASELQISEKNMNWGTSVNYNYQGTFEPASTINGTNWFSGEGTSRTDGQQKANTDWAAISSANASKYYFTDMLNVRNNGSAAINGVTITFSLGEDPVTNGKNYVRVALAEVTAASDTAAKTANPTAAQFQAGIFDVDGVKYNGVSAVDTATTELTPKTTYSVSVGNLAGKTAQATATKYYRLYVWFEGQDVDCQDQYAGNSLPSITFSVSGTTATS